LWFPFFENKDFLTMGVESSKETNWIEVEWQLRQKKLFRDVIDHNGFLGYLINQVLTCVKGEST
jgi:hypothetical protein